jgi:hypothetical protein
MFEFLFSSVEQLAEEVAIAKLVVDLKRFLILETTELRSLHVGQIVCIDRIAQRTEGMRKIFNFPTIASHLLMHLSPLPHPQSMSSLSFTPQIHSNCLKRRPQP